MTSGGASVAAIEFQGFREGFGETLAEFVAGAFLAIHAGHFVDPTDPPLSATFDDCGVLHFNPVAYTVGTGAPRRPPSTDTR